MKLDHNLLGVILLEIDDCPTFYNFPMLSKKCHRVFKQRFQIIKTITHIPPSNSMYTLDRKTKCKHGMFRKWDWDGLWMEKYYFHGLLHGISKDWTADGILSSQSNWYYGRLHGQQYGWHSNSQLAYTAYYHYGLKHGVGQRWYRRQLPMTEIHYRYGKLHGLFREWSESRALITCRVYWHNELIYEFDHDANALPR